MLEPLKTFFPLIFGAGAVAPSILITSRPCHHLIFAKSDDSLVYS